MDQDQKQKWSKLGVALSGIGGITRGMEDIKWELIAAGEWGSVSRMAVPSGWIYRFRERPQGRTVVNYVFVPLNNTVEAGD